jgi:uncharacterized protein YaaQ
MTESIPKKNTNDRLLMAVIQAQDSDSAVSALETIGVTVTKLPSVGGFLGRRNATLLMGLPDDNRAKAVEALNKTCRQRIEYIAVPLESAPFPLPAPTPITIGGATVFALEVEYYEEF